MLLDRKELQKVRLRAMVEGNKLAAELATTLLDVERYFANKLRLKLGIERDGCAAKALEVCMKVQLEKLELEPLELGALIEEAIIARERGDHESECECRSIVTNCGRTP
jgi:hypothetical protein